MPQFQKIFRDADRQQALADMMMQRAQQSSAPVQQGRITPKMGIGHGLADLGSDLLAAYMTKRAGDTRSKGEEQRRMAQAAALSGMGGQDTMLASTDGGVAQGGNKFQMAQQAIGSGVNPALVGQWLQSQQPNLEWKDVGDALVLINERGEELQRVPKGASPDTRLRTDVTIRGQDLSAESQSAGRDVTMRGQDLTADNARLGHDVSLRGQDLSAETTRRGQDVTMRGQDIAAQTSLQKQDQVIDKKNSELQKTWDTYVAARHGMMEGLGNSSTGPLVGLVPPFTANQQIAEGAVSAMAPVLKQLFRVAGEGVFTDRDQALLLEMVPDRTDQPEARRQKMANIDAIVQAKLGIQAMPNAPEESANPELDSLMQQYGAGGY